MDDQSDVEMLGRTELFRGAPVELLREIQRAAFRKRFAAGETVLRQGDATATVYIVVIGRLRATQTTLDGQQVIIRYLGPGEVAGYAALAGGETYPGSLIAVDDCHLVGWSAAIIQDIMPTASRNTLSRNAMRQPHARNAASSMKFRTAAVRWGEISERSYLNARALKFPFGG